MNATISDAYIVWANGGSALTYTIAGLTGLELATIMLALDRAAEDSPVEETRNTAAALAERLQNVEYQYEARRD